MDGLDKHGLSWTDYVESQGATSTPDVQQQGNLIAPKGPIQYILIISIDIFCRYMSLFIVDIEYSMLNNAYNVSLILVATLV